MSHTGQNTQKIKNKNLRIQKHNNRGERIRSDQRERIRLGRHCESDQIDTTIREKESDHIREATCPEHIREEPRVKKNQIRPWKKNQIRTYQIRP